MTDVQFAQRAIDVLRTRFDDYRYDPPPLRLRTLLLLGLVFVTSLAIVWVVAYRDGRHDREARFEAEKKAFAEKVRAEDLARAAQLELELGVARVELAAARAKLDDTDRAAIERIDRIAATPTPGACTTATAPLNAVIREVHR